MLDATFQFKELATGNDLAVQPDVIEPFDLEALLGTQKEGSPGLPRLDGLDLSEGSPQPFFFQSHNLGFFDRSP